MPSRAPAPDWTAIFEKKSPRVFAKEVLDPFGVVQGILLCMEAYGPDDGAVLSTKTEYLPGLTLAEVRQRFRPEPSPLLRACPSVDRFTEDPPHRETYRFLLQDQDENYPMWGWRRADTKSGGHWRPHQHEAAARAEAWEDYDVECTPALYAERVAIADDLLSEVATIQTVAHEASGGSYETKTDALRDVAGRATTLRRVLGLLKSPRGQHHV